MIYGSVCSGIEAASVGWAPLGWSAAFVSEIDKFPCAVLAHRFPDVPLHGDFTTIEENQYEPIDLLVGGTPCQSFSIAGLRGGLDDDRGNLALEYLRLAQRLRPKWLVWENVPGVLSSGQGRDFGSILGGLAELGYGFAYRVLDAQYVRVDGFARAVPQRRRRVFVVGYIGDWRRAAAVLFERESLSGHIAPRREARQRIADSLTVGANQCSGFPGDITHDVSPALVSSGRGVERTGETRGQDAVVAVAASFGASPSNAQSPNEDATLVPSWPAEVSPTVNTKYGDKMGLEDQHALNGAGMFVPDVNANKIICASDGQWNATFSENVAPTLNTVHEQPYMAVTHALRAEGFDASEDGTGRGTPLVPDTAPTLVSEGDAHTGFRDEHGLVPTAYSIMPMNSGKDYKARETDVSQPLMAGGPVGGNQGGDYVADPIAWTEELTASENVAGTVQRGGGGGRHDGVMQPDMSVRRLTPTECERLQGFPDNWTRIPYRGKDADACPDGPRYKALGNSMAVNVMRWIGQRIDAVEKL